jgi:hypothetical protein
VEAIELSNISLQSDCIRKLIVSEVNMFKNIEYDLLNISRQMELITPGSQIECFVVNYKDAFLCPIISLYAEGPVVANRSSPPYPDTRSSTSSAPSSAPSSRSPSSASTKASLAGS